MSKIDRIHWKKYIVGDLFDIHPTSSYKMTNSQLLDGGENPVVVNSGYNNGIGGYTSQKTNEKGNMITFSDTTSAEAIFYQPSDFVGYPHVQGMYPKGKYKEDWTELRLLFFMTSFKKSSILKNFDYSYKFTREIVLSMEVELPSIENGEIDWRYIDAYMYRVMCDAKERIQKIKRIKYYPHRINSENWKPFVLGKLFDKIQKPQVLHTRQVIEDDDGVPYIVRTKFNNGVKCRVKAVENVPLSPAGVITWGAENATFFYQEEAFLSGRDIYYIDTRNYKRNTCLFLVSCLRKIAKKYPYNFGLFPELLKKEIIELPVTSEGKPDWIFIEDYMSQVIDNSYIDIGKLKQSIHS